MIRYVYVTEPVLLAGRRRVHYVVSVAGTSDWPREGEAVAEVAPPHPELPYPERYLVWRSETTVCGKHGPWQNAGLAGLEGHQDCSVCWNSTQRAAGVPDWAHAWVEKTRPPDDS